LSAIGIVEAVGGKATETVLPHEKSGDGRSVWPTVSRPASLLFTDSGAQRYVFEKRLTAKARACVLAAILFLFLASS